MVCSNTWVNIDLDAILDNFRAVKEKSGKMVCAVVKADAYGHGAVPVAQLLEKECDFFGVSSVAEALELRLAKIEKPILLLGHTPAALFPETVKYDLRPAIFDWQEAQMLSAEAVRQGKTVNIHIALDTGMSRIGFAPTEENAKLCSQIAKPKKNMFL